MKAATAKLSPRRANAYVHDCRPVAPPAHLIPGLCDRFGPSTPLTSPVCVMLHSAPRPRDRLPRDHTHFLLARARLSVSSMRARSLN